MTTFSFKVDSFRKTPSPYSKNNEEQVSYIAICNVKHLPQDIPCEQTNPRQQNLGTKVARDIKESFLKNENFWLLNRGLLISADSVQFNNSTNQVTLKLPNPEKHGNVDGGHTYRIIKENKDKIGQDGNVTEQFVKIEIVTGAEGFFEDLAGARNTSVQVDLKSLAELKDGFQIIKDAIGSEPFFDDIGWKQFENKRIDAREIVAILTMFNINQFDEKSQPVSSYSSKETCVRRYLDEIKNSDNAFKNLQGVAKDIFHLYSYIEEKMPEAYKNKVGGESGKNAKYGKIKGVSNEPYKTLFTNKEIGYESPKGFIYPILAAFRALLEKDSESGFWKWADNADPFEYFDALSEDLVWTTIERSRLAGHNPQSVGKDSGHWGALYSKVQARRYMKKIELLEKQAAA